MYNTREGGSVNHSLVLHETNYAYWKARMCTFLKFVDNKIWKAVINGWPALTIKDDKYVIVSTMPEKDWDVA